VKRTKRISGIFRIRADRCDHMGYGIVRKVCVNGLIVTCAVTIATGPLVATGETRETRRTVTGDPSRSGEPDGTDGTGTVQAPAAPLGVFLGSDERGANRMAAFEAWLGATVPVGRTYLPGENWAALSGPDFILKPWTAWLRARPGRSLVLNVPMVAPNEGNLPDAQVSALLRAGANGARDATFRELARRLVAAGAPDTVIVLGWEMNGTTYSSRCAPDPTAWKAYWRRIVAKMREVSGQRFRFDFTASRGRDAIAWPACYPGDDVVDIIGMDSYDQQPGERFADYVSQPYGLRHHAEFAAEHRKPISFPEWGLFRYGDRPDYVRDMLDWITKHDVAYHSISDYCPHGVWQCAENPRSAQVFRNWAARSPAVLPRRGVDAALPRTPGDGATR
jgi:hypothetical protein